MQTDPHNYLAEDAGLGNLGPVANWIPYFQFTSINIRRDWGQRNQAALVRFLAASIQASQWMFDDRTGAVALTCQCMDIAPRYAERAWDDHVALDAVPVDLHLNANSIDTCVAMIRRDRSSKFTIAADASAEKYVDLSFLREAQQLAGVPSNPLVK